MRGPAPRWQRRRRGVELGGRLRRGLVLDNALEDRGRGRAARAGLGDRGPPLQHLVLGERGIRLKPHALEDEQLHARRTPGHADIAAPVLMAAAQLRTPPMPGSAHAMALLPSLQNARTHPHHWSNYYYYYYYYYDCYYYY